MARGAFTFWHEQLAFAVARSRGCRVVVVPRGALAICGLLAAVANAAALYRSLLGEVERVRELRVERSGKRSAIRHFGAIWRERFNYGFTASIMSRLTPLYADTISPTHDALAEYIQAAADAQRRAAEVNQHIVDAAAAAIHGTGLSEPYAIGVASQVYDRAFEDGFALGLDMNLGRWPPPAPPPRPPDPIDIAHRLPAWGGPTRFSELDARVDDLEVADRVAKDLDGGEFDPVAGTVERFSQLEIDED